MLCVVYYEKLRTDQSPLPLAACRLPWCGQYVDKWPVGRPDLARLFLLQIDFRLWLWTACVSVCVCRKLVHTVLRAGEIAFGEIQMCFMFIELCGTQH